MAATQGIRSALSKQHGTSSPKLRIYEYLFLLNQKLQDTVHILRQLEKFSWLRRDFLRSFQVEIEDLRAQTNCEVIEHLSDREQRDWARFGKLRRQWDRQFEDPDDVYLKAEQREQERRKRGLPPRLGIIPHAAVAAEEEDRLEAEQGRQTRRPKKHRKQGGRFKGGIATVDQRQQIRS